MNSLNCSAGTSGTCGIEQGRCNKSDQRCGLTALWRSISEADCLAHYQKVDGANPSSATSVKCLRQRKTQNADPDPGFHHPVRFGKKRGNSMGNPCVQRLCSAKYMSLCWVLVSVTRQSKRPAWRNWQRSCLVSRRLQVRFLPSALGQGMHFRVHPNARDGAGTYLIRLNILLIAY